MCVCVYARLKILDTYRRGIRLLFYEFLKSIFLLLIQMWKKRGVGDRTLSLEYHMWPELTHLPLKYYTTSTHRWAQWKASSVLLEQIKFMFVRQKSQPPQCSTQSYALGLR